MAPRTTMFLTISLGTFAVMAQSPPLQDIPGGCNPAHPGSCPSSYFDTTSTAVHTFASIPGIPGGGNPAHPGSFPTAYTHTNTTTLSSTKAAIHSTGGLPATTSRPPHTSGAEPVVNFGAQFMSLSMAAVVAATAALWWPM